MKHWILTLLAAVLCLTAAAQDTDDPNVARCETIFEYVLNDQPDSLYARMSDQVKSMITPQQLTNMMPQVEAQMGKYQTHTAWEKQEMMGHEVYVSLVSFEKSQLGMLIIFDNEGKMLGINMVDPAAIKKN